MRAASAPYERLAALAFLQCFWFVFSVFSHGLPAARHSFRRSLKTPSSKEGTAKTPFQHFSERGQHLRPPAKIKRSSNFPGFLKLNRMLQIKFATAGNTNRNRALQFTFSTSNDPGLPLDQRSNNSEQRRDCAVNRAGRRLTEKRHFEDSFVASVSGDEHVFLPVVDEKYSRAAKLINEYVARDSLLFDDPDGPCPQANWMRVDGRTGRCFKSFDFADLRSSGSTAEGHPASKRYGTWEEAEHLCMAFGAHLAALHTAAETRFAHMVLDRRPGACWIGLRRAQPQGRRRHEDPSNGWKWITSNQGILEDSDPVEWTRDWQPVWDSISYGPQLCGVFTRKGIAARRCYPISNTRPTAEGRWRRNATEEGDKKSPTGLSCFLCATAARGSRLPSNSYARAAEEGNFDWQPGEDISKETFPTYVHENSYSRHGSSRFKEERKGTRESRNGKNSWILRPQDRLTKRESKTNPSRAQGFTEAIEGQGYHPRETRGDTYRVHVVRGDQGVDRGRLRRENSDDGSAHYIGGSPTLVESPSPKAVSGDFDNEVGGPHRPHASGAWKHLKLRGTSFGGSEGNASENVSERARHSYTPYLTDFESDDEYERAEGLQDSHNDRGIDDLEAETAWLARTSASMRDEKTYSEFLQRFMEMQRRKQMQRKEEESHDRDAPAVEKQGESDEHEHSLRRISHFLDDDDAGFAGDVTNTEGNQGQNTGTHGLAVRPAEEETPNADEGAETAVTVGFVPVSEGRNTSPLSEYSTESLEEEALNYAAESRTGRKRKDWKRQRRFLLWVACGCGIGAAFALAALVLACVHCRVSPSQGEEVCSSEMDDKKVLPELRDKSAGTAADSSYKNIAPRGASRTDQVCLTEVSSLSSSPSSFSRFPNDVPLKMQNLNKHVNPAMVLEPKGSLTRSKDSTENGRTTAATVGRGPTVSVCSTHHHRLASPLACQIHRNSGQSGPCMNKDNNHCAADCVKEQIMKNALDRRQLSPLGEGSCELAASARHCEALSRLNSLLSVNTEQNHRAADFGDECEIQNVPTCSRIRQDGEDRVLGKGWERKARDAGDELILFPSSRPLKLKGHGSEHNRELCLVRQEQSCSESGEKEYVSRALVSGNSVKARLVQTVCGETVPETVPHAASSSVCSRTFPDHGLPMTSQRSETPGTATFSCTASVSDVSWREHQAASLFEAEQSTAADAIGAVDVCSLARAEKETIKNFTEDAPSFEETSLSRGDKQRLTAMERLSRLRRKIGAM